MTAPSDELDLSAIRRELEAQRDASRARVARLARTPERGSGLGFGKRIGDGTIEAVSRLTDIGVGGALEKGLARTERALEKLDEGTYGRCDGCGAPIPHARLRAMPAGVRCVACAAAEAGPRRVQRR